MLIVVIAIATAAGVRLFKPVSKWADFYMGTYTECLLDSGELPKLAGGNPQECDELAEQAGYNTDPNKANQNNQNANKNNESLSGETVGSNGGAGKSGSGSGRFSARRGGKSFQTDNPRPSKAGSDSAGQNDEETSSGSGRVRFVGENSRNAFRNQSNKVKILGFSSLLDEEKKKIKRREERISKAGEVDPTLRPPKKLLIKPPQKKSVEDTNENIDFTIGNFLRMFIIISIIILTIAVIVSQLNTISKGMDK